MHCFHQVPGIPIPVGSCTYDVKILLDLVCAMCAEEGNCDDFLPDGQGCALPMKPGHYGGVTGGKDVVTLIIPEIPAIIRPFLTGTLLFEILGTTAAGAEDLCAKLTIELV